MAGPQGHNVGGLDRGQATSTTTTILAADDEPGTLLLIGRVVRRLGHRVVTATSGAEALEVFRRERPDAVLLDARMPGMDGFEVCRRLKDDPSSRLVPVVLVTALAASEDRVRGIDAGADDFVTKPFVVAELEARLRSLLHQKRYTDELESAEKLMLTLASTIEARDPYTGGHCERLASYASGFGRRLGLPEEDIVVLNRGGFLHDVGKIGVPDSILLKPARLTAAEFAIIQEHPAIGDRLCSQLASLATVRPVVRHHHERLDGSGYPDRLRGDQIPLLAQIISIVDSFDAMTTDRPYRPGMSRNAAIDELWADAARGWKCGDLVETFEALCRERGPELVMPSGLLAGLAS